MKIGAVVVAAGMSSRMKSFKPMLPMGETTIIQRLIHTLQQGDVHSIVLVTGNQAALLEEHVAHMGVTCLFNPDYAVSQMFDSAKMGFSFLEQTCDKILFTPGDIPLFTVDTISKLTQHKGDLVIPLCDGKQGHPIVISTTLVPAIVNFAGEGGLRMALASCGTAIAHVPVADRGILLDADTPEDYQYLLQKYEKLL